MQPSARQLDHGIWSWNLLDCHFRDVLYGQFRCGGVGGRRDVPGVHERRVVAVRAAGSVGSVHGIRYTRADGSCVVVHVAERKPERRTKFGAVVVAVPDTNATADARTLCYTKHGTLFCAVAGTNNCGTNAGADSHANYPYYRTDERADDAGSDLRTEYSAISGTESRAVADSYSGSEYGALRCS